MVKATTMQLLSVSKTFSFYNGRKAVIENIDLEIPSDEIIFLCGLNGSGKSTLFKIIAGLQAPDANSRIMFENNLLSRDILKRESIYIPQNIDDALVNDLYLYEYLRIFELQSIIESANIIDADWIIEMFRNRTRVLLRDLSQGQRQLVLIIALLSKKERIFLFDEVFSSIDPKHTDKLWKLITAKLLLKHKISLFIGHDYHFAYTHAERLIVLFNGKIIMNCKKQSISFEGFVDAITNGHYENSNI